MLLRNVNPENKKTQDFYFLGHFEVEMSIYLYVEVTLNIGSARATPRPWFLSSEDMEVKEVIGLSLLVC